MIEARRLLEGAIDTHVHSAPDVIERKLDDLQVARQARERGMAAVVLKNHFLPTPLRARLAGYRSQTISLANRRPMDPPDVGTILLHRLGASEGSTISAVSLRAPKDAKKAYDKGLDALKKNDL